ncbi:MAG: hypothetical protein J6D26_07405 [Clostridia bacterium]|nr:hypothetical protein [Clostridia bacterium]
MRKIAILLAVILSLITIFPTGSFANEVITVSIDGINLNFDDAVPFTESGRVLVPLRVISENLNMKVDYNDNYITVSNDNDKFIVIQIGSNTAYVNGEAVALETPPILKNGCTYVPLRFLIENYGYDVEWDGENQKVLINTYNARFTTETAEKIKDIKQNITGAVEFTVAEPADNGIYVSVADFGASPSATPQENVKAFEDAIARVKEINASKLIIPQGVYYLGEERKTQISFVGISDLLVDGMGSELIFTEHETASSGEFIYIEDCNRLKLYNLTIDWDYESYPTIFIGEVKSIDFDTHTVEFTADGINIPDKFVFGGGYDWDIEANNKVPQDKYTFPKGNVVSSVKTGPNSFSVTFKNSNNFKEAKVGSPTHLNLTANYNANGVQTTKSKDIIFNKVTMHSVPYIGFNTSLIENLEFNEVKVVPREGRRFSSYGGLETHHVYRNVKLVNSTLDGIFDDMMHMSNNYLGAGAIKVDDYTVIMDHLQHFAHSLIIQKGMKMVMKTSEFEDIDWQSEIVDYEWQMDYYPGASAAHRCVVKFKDPLPEGYQNTNMFFSRGFEGNYIIRNNVLRNGSCHALYYGMPNGLVENNVMENLAYPPFTIHTVFRWGRWTIGDNARNVIIRNNTIKGSNYAQRDPATFFIGGGYDNQPSNYIPVKGFPAQNILMENNTIEDSVWAAFGMFSAKNVIVINNKFINSNLRKSRAKFEGMGNAYIYNAEDVVFAGNSNENTVNTYESGLFVDEYTTKNIVLEDNIGFGDTITMKERVEKLGQKYDDNGALIVDTGTFGYEELKGSWSNSSYKGYGSAQSRQCPTDTAQVRFKPFLESGTYRVAVYRVAATANENASVLVKVAHKDGEYETTFDATQGGSGFVDIGEFEFNEGLTGYVDLMINGSKIMRVSAVKFEKID